MNIMMIKNVITRGAGRGLLLGKKFSPEILMATGVVGVIGSTVLACRATLKAEEIIDEAKANMEKINQAKKYAEDGLTKNYSEADYNKDMGLQYLHSAGKFVKLYGPAITLGVASIACILGSHGIMRRRNVALTAAYKVIEESFSSYRKRVIEEQGVDADRHFMYGTKEVKVTKIGENNEEVNEVVNIIDGKTISQYAKIFDKNSVNWSDVPEYNMTFLITQQRFANDLLQSRGHVFLNEIYDALGLPRTQAGAVVGWVKGNGDNVIDFGMFQTNVADYASDNDMETIGEKRAEFINGARNAVMLDFNVDGVIYDLI